MVKKIGVLTSGGDAPGMNAAIRAVTRVAIDQGIEVYGIYDGYKGLVEGDIHRLTHNDVSNILSRGGTILGSARLPEFKEERVRKQAIANLEKLGIEAVVVIGGDGTYQGALCLTQMGINCIAIPGTIDNDISSTDETIGFNTALNTIVDAVDKLRDTSTSHHRCAIVEVMGNHCGDLALYAGIACGAEIVITNETGFDEEHVLTQLQEFARKHKRLALVLISEKITDVESFARKVSTYTDFSGRATILGHIQRGGIPTSRDRILASEMGEKAVELLMDGQGGKCVGIIDGKITAMDIEKALAIPRKSRRDLQVLFDRLV